MVQVKVKKPDEIYENWNEVVEITEGQRNIVPGFVYDAVDATGVYGSLAAKFGAGHW